MRAYLGLSGRKGIVKMVPKAKTSWKAMGNPGDPNIFVVPLPVHVSGW